MKMRLAALFLHTRPLVTYILLLVAFKNLLLGDNSS
jgi:hypothetical protein